MSEVILISLDQLEGMVERVVRKVISEEKNGSSSIKDEILDIRQAAEYLHIPFRSIYNLTYKRLIPHFKKGKRVLFNKESLNEWVKSGKKETIESIQLSLIRKK
ncbi:MAG TPA: helix-turn-helix domain-containing protein [Cytophagaceae bacterium]|jgi:excisionase family DNA binding protein|nr:helix-turn-helix domain-containing protein [Cytophagaceae bacterium]